jgi:hypothetical protein
VRTRSGASQELEAGLKRANDDAAREIEQRGTSLKRALEQRCVAGSVERSSRLDRRVARRPRGPAARGGAREDRIPQHVTLKTSPDNFCRFEVRIVA